jgi:hypothetical protein
MIPKVSNSDILQAFIQEVPEAQRPAVERNYATHADRLRVHAELKALWQENLGHLFECPQDNDLFTFLKMAKWEMELIGMAVEDLRSRAKHPFEQGREHDHAMRHFSSALIRRIRSRYGPAPERMAA